jgi:hypothetical protein
MIDSEDGAYQMLAKVALDFVKDRDWSKAVCKCQIYDGMVSSSEWLESVTGEVDDKALDWGDTSLSAADAAEFLKNDLLQKTGSRIWGLTCTLYPTGKFNIDYDYNKPEDYEESDEQITGAQANESLFKLGFRGGK